MKSQDLRKPSGLTECVIQPSAILPTRVSANSEPPESAWPSDSRSALVASQIGQGFWMGFGSSVMLENLTNLPSNGSLSLVQRWRSTCMFSTMCLRRSSGLIPIAAVSASHSGPAPPPAQATSRVRPFEITSSEAHS